MPKLKCSAHSCCYNQNSNCLKSIVKVEGECATSRKETCCSSYKRKDRVDKSNEYNAEFAFLGENMRASINCACVKCKHNRNEMCYAESVAIDGKNARTLSETNCESFTEK